MRKKSYFFWLIASALTALYASVLLTMAQTNPIPPALSAIGFAGGPISATHGGFSIVTADFDGDGTLDLAIGNRNTPTPSVSLLIGIGNGSFRPSVDYVAFGEPFSLATGDFDGNGSLDLAVAERNGSNSYLSLYLGNGDGTLQAPKNDLVVGADLFSVVVGDFNRDNKLDLAAVDDYSGKVLVFLGNGDGTFQPPLGYPGATVSAVTGDFNADGKLDLAVTDFYTDSISVLLGNGDGTFQPARSYAGGQPYGAEYLVAADMNGDGILDIAMTDGVHNIVSIFLGNGDGTLLPHQDYPSGTGPLAIAANDFDADGATDVATVNICGNDPIADCSGNLYGTVSVLLGKGDGTFEPRLDFTTTGLEPQGLAVGDFNKDGRLDFGTATNSAVNVLFSTTAVLSPGAPIFPSEEVGAESSPLIVTLTNTAAKPLHISGVTMDGNNPGDYSQDNTCGNLLAPGANCTFSVVFSPTIADTRSALLQVADDALGSPQMVQFAGIGLGAVAEFSPTSLDMGTVDVGVLSGSKGISLTNAGTIDLVVSSATITGADPLEFGQRNTCTTPIAPGASCGFTVVFKPRARGLRSASLTIVDNAPGSPHTISLTGHGTVLTVSPTSIYFGNQQVGTTSAPQTVTVTNDGAKPINILGIGIFGQTADFAQTNNCGVSLPSHSSCTVSVTFTPTKLGGRSSVLKVSGGGGSPGLVSLGGNGI